MGELNFISTIRNLIAANKSGEALQKLVDKVKGVKDLRESQDDLILLLSRYNSLMADHQRGLLTPTEYNLEHNRIRHSILRIVTSIAMSLTNGSEGKSKIKILFLAANPFETAYLRLDKELRAIEAELVKSKFRQRFELLKFSAVTIGDLQDTLLNYHPDFLHFSGHGEREGILLMDEQMDGDCLVDSEALARLLGLFSDHLKCVFLNSCYSLKQGQLIKQFITHVIGMNSEVPDAVAIEFAATFYKGIGAGHEIDFSFELARNSLTLKNLGGANIPGLL